MGTIRKRQNALLAILSVISMIGGGALLYQTLNVYYNYSSALVVISLLILSVCLYVAGAVMMGRCANMNNTRYFHSGINGSVVFALTVVAVGLLLLGFNTGDLPAEWKRFFFSWPMMLLVMGVAQMFKSHSWGGIALTITGIFFLFTKVSTLFPDDIFYKQFVSTYWPILIIAGGLLILLTTAMGSGRHFSRNRNRWRFRNTSNESESNDGRINYRFVFGGTERVVLDPVFRGGNVDISFGGMELDLRRTSLAEGDTFLYINVVFGGVEIMVPDDWNVECRSNSFAGGCVDDSKRKDLEKDRTRKLIIITRCTFGGVEIR